MISYYKVKTESDFYEDYMASIEEKKKFEYVYKEMCEILNLKPTSRYAANATDFWYDVAHIEESGQKALFSKDGYLKRNNKQANEYRRKYLQTVEKHGLKNYQSTFEVSFNYGFMRSSSSQKMESFHGLTTIYVHTDFDLLNSSTDDMSYLEVITETDYIEAHLAAVKSKTEQTA